MVLIFEIGNDILRSTELLCTVSLNNHVGIPSNTSECPGNYIYRKVNIVNLYILLIKYIYVFHIIFKQELSVICIQK